MDRLSVMFVLFIIAAIFFAPSSEASTPVDYDSSFDGGYTLYMLSDYQYAQDVVTDTAGNVFVALVVGTSASATGYRPAVMKLSSGGQVDPSFGSSGIFVVAKDFPSSELRSSSVDIALEASGKIYLSFPGEGGNPATWNFFLARILADGSALDSTFGLLGLTVAAVDQGGGGADLPRDVAVQDDGKILVVGTAESNSGNWSAIARFTSAGALDSGFGTGGVSSANISIDSVEASVPWAVAEASAGEIFIAGEGSTAAGHELILIEFAPNGAYQGYMHLAYQDPGTAQSSVENRGRGLTIVRGSGPSYYADEIYVVGESYDPNLLFGTREMAVVKITGTLNVDVTFGTQGWSLIDFSDNSLFGIGDTEDSGTAIFYDAPSGGLFLIGSATDQDPNPTTYAAATLVDMASGSVMQGPGKVWKAYYASVAGHGNLVSGTCDARGRPVLVTDMYTNDTYRQDAQAARLLGSAVFADDFEGGSLTSWTSSSP